jgi:hypothetical protein
MPLVAEVIVGVLTPVDCRCMTVCASVATNETDCVIPKERTTQKSKGSIPEDRCAHFRTNPAGDRPVSETKIIITATL